MSDRRVYFAAERTQLAWLRTGLTIMALGFVVARFGLFLLIMAASRAAGGEPHAHWQSGAIGIALVVLGAMAIFASQYNHRRYLRALPVEDIPKLPLPWLTSLLSLAVACVGVLMAAYLAFT